MPINLTLPQTAVFNSQARFRVLVAGRRFGKTFLSVSELCRAVWKKPNTIAWYLAPTYRQAKQIAWEELKRTAGPYALRKPNETELSLTLKGGGTIALRGADKYDSLRGVRLDFAVFDEYADMKASVWPEIIRPALSDRKGNALWIGTPKGFGGFYDLYQKARDTENWGAWQYTTLQGGNVAAEEIEAARNDLDEKTFRQEYEASFENFAGRCYFAFERSRNVRPSAFIPSRPGICWSLDFNVNPMSSVICQIEEEDLRFDLANYGQHRRGSGRRLEVLDEIVLPNSNTLQACEEFERRVAPWLQKAGGRLELAVYGDSSGEARSTAGRSDYLIIREFFRVRPEFKVSYHVPAANPPVRDRVNAMNGMLQNASGDVRMWLNPRCKRLIADLEQVAWKSDANGNMTGDMDKKNPLLTHVSDALGYLVESEFGMRQHGGPRTSRIV